MHNYDVFIKFFDFEHILMFIGIRKRDNVKEGVLLPIEKGGTLKFSANSDVSDCIAPYTDAKDAEV